MRDLGKMGESAFNQLCASAGLAANGSSVDKTGWDFLIEFDFPTDYFSENRSIHHSAHECKIQVKSPDKRDRKIPVKLSNLKRMATSAQPAFFVFLEYDGEENPQAIFLVHVDFLHISRILDKLQEVENLGENHKLNKKTMTITYDESNRLPSISGQSLALKIRDHIGPNMAEYINRKNSYLEYVGFEDGFAEIEFVINDAENLSKLIDSSIGIESEANVTDLIGFKKRFGRKKDNPFINEKKIKLEIVDLKPNHEVILKITTQNLGSAFSFPSRLFVSPFLDNLPHELRKSRLECDFFSFVLNPYKNQCVFSTNFQNNQFEIQGLNKQLKFLREISKTGQGFEAIFIVENMPPLKFQLTSPGMKFNFDNEILAIEAGIRLISKLEIYNTVTISTAQLTDHSDRIINFEKIVGGENKAFRIEIPAQDFSLPMEKDIAFIDFFATPIGDIRIGAFTSMIGKAFKNDDESFTIYGTQTIVEKIVVREQSECVSKETLETELKLIIERYNCTHSVVTGNFSESAL